MSNFTVRQLDSLPLPEKGKRKIYYDDDVKGLALRVTSIGTKTFLTIKRVNGKKVFTTLGHYPNMTIGQARAKARNTLNIISEGINPNLIKSEGVNKFTITLQKVFDDYILSRGTNLNEETVKGYRSILKNQLSDWKNKPISDITRDMVEQRHRDITYGIG